MRLFDDIISEVRAFAEGRRSGHPYREERGGGAAWPLSEKTQIVLGADTGAELGNPRDESASFLLWTPDVGLIRDNGITLIGPDIGKDGPASLPFGKVLLLGVKEFGEAECYDHHRDLDLMRFDLRLEGYMMRAASQYMREWSRVDRRVLEKGYNLPMLGRALMDHYRTSGLVTAAEMLFVTSSPGDVRALAQIGQRAFRLIAAMNKMTEEMSFDCDTCDYLDVCSEVADLKNLRNTLQKEVKSHVH